MKRPTYPNGLPYRLISCTTVAMAAILFLLPITSSAQQYTLKPLPNPLTTGACGLDVMLVLDESGSIRDTQAIEHVQDATLGFLEALADTGSRVAVSEFNSTARVVLNHTTVTSGPDGAIETVFRPYLTNDFNPPDSPFWYTNWNDAMKQVSLVNESQRSQLVVFVTDGDPTAFNNEHPGELQPTTMDEVTINTISTGRALTQTTAYANIVKNQGSRVVAVGVGNALDSQASQERLKVISGPNLLGNGVLGTSAFDPAAILEADVILVQDFTDLKSALRNLALSLCGSSLTISKQVDHKDGEGYQPAQGWSFSGSVALDSPENSLDYDWSLPNPGAAAGETVPTLTDSDGTATFQWSPRRNANAQVAATAAERLGYRFVDASCTVRSLGSPEPQPLAITLNGSTIQANLAPADVATCIMRSDIIAGSVVVEAQPPYQRLRIGESATFDFAVRNGSDEPLKELVIESSHCANPSYLEGDTNSDGLLQPTEKWRYRCQSAPTQHDFTNVVTVTAKDPANRPVEPALGQNIVDVMNPTVALQVSPKRQFTAVGSNARLTLEVTNPGDADLFDIRTRSDQCEAVTYIDGDSNRDRILQTHERWRYDCLVENVQSATVVTAFAEGEDPNGTPVPPATDSGTIDIHVDNVCNVGDFRGALQRTKIFGAGMGDRYESINPVTVSLPDQGRLIGLKAQMAGRWRGALPYQVTFDSGLETVTMSQQTTINESRDNYRLFTYETDMEPYGDIKFSVDDQVVRSWRTPRGAVLYADYQSRSEYYEVVRQINAQAYWGWGKNAHTEVVSIPPLGAARTIYLTAVLIDNDPDDRPLVFRARAGGVTTELSDNGPTHGPNLSIYYLKLPNVPVGTSEVELIMESPEGIGDSLEWAGYSVSLSCTPDSDDDGVPDAGEDLNGDGDFTNDDTDNNGTPNYLDPDDDGDGTPTEEEDRNGNLDPEDDDSDGDSIPDYLDSDDSAPPPVTPVPEPDGADLSLAAAALTGPEAIAGTRAEFSVVVRNTGPHVAEDVEILTTLPVGVELRSATVVQNEEEGNANPQEGAECATLPDLPRLVVCPVGTMDVNAATEIALGVALDPALVDEHELIVRAEVHSSTHDHDLVNNRDSATVSARSQSSLSLESSVSNASPKLGEVLTYHIRVFNQGPSVARDVVLHQALPEEMTFVDSSILCELAEDELGLNYACPLGETAGADAIGGFDLDVGQSVVVDINARVNESANCGPAWESLAWVHAANMDGHSFADASVAAGCVADVRVHQFGNQLGRLDPSVPVTLSVLVENIGPDMAQQVGVDIAIEMSSPTGDPSNLPAFDIELVKPDPFGDRDYARCDVLSAFNIQNGRKEIHCDLDDEFEVLNLANGGGRWLIEMVVKSIEGGPLFTEATVTTGTDDPNEQNNHIQSESDATILASVLPPLDSDGDNIPDYRDLDLDNDGLPNSVEGDADTDGDGTPDMLDDDSDADGIGDIFEGDVDTDEDNTPDYRDTDSDGDGILDIIEGVNPTQLREQSPDELGKTASFDEVADLDGDGIPDFQDTDSDNDTIPDRMEGEIDTDGDGVPNYRDTDSDGDGTPDQQEGMLDQNQNGVPDYLDDTIQSVGYDGGHSQLAPTVFVPFMTQ